MRCVDPGCRSLAKIVASSGLVGPPGPVTDWLRATCLSLLLLVTLLNHTAAQYTSCSTRDCSQMVLVPGAKFVGLDTGPNRARMVCEWCQKKRAEALRELLRAVAQTLARGVRALGGSSTVDMAAFESRTDQGAGVDLFRLQHRREMIWNDRRIVVSASDSVTKVSLWTGDTHLLDYSTDNMDAGWEATFDLDTSLQNGRIGAGYRANLTEHELSFGRIGKERSSDYRFSGSISYGLPSAGFFVTLGDRDHDETPNYRVDVSVPVPGWPVGLSIAHETERPSDLLAAALTPVLPYSGLYLAGRAIDLW